MVFILLIVNVGNLRNLISTRDIFVLLTFDFALSFKLRHQSVEYSFVVKIRKFKLCF